MSTFISDVVDDDTITCEVCKETFKTDEVTTDDFNFAWDNLVSVDCCSSCSPQVRRRRNFLLFTADQYYPSGGMSDCKGQFDTLQEAINYTVRNQPDGWLDDMHVLEVGDDFIVHHIKPDTGTVEVSIRLKVLPHKDVE